MLVSIIVPIYNSARFLKRCINSLVNQTYKNLEIILIDDGSEDNSLEICKSYEIKDKRIKVIHQENAGVSSARNKGIQNSEGDLLCFIDSDDYAEATMIEKMVRIFKKDKEIDIVMCGYYEYVKKKREIKFCESITEIDKKEIPELILKSCNSPYLNAAVNKGFKSSLIKENNILYDTSVSLGEDFLFNLNAINHAKKIVLIPDCLYYYRGDNIQSLTHKVRKNLLQDELRMYHAVNHCFAECENKIYQAKAEGYIIMVIRVYLSTIFKNKVNRKERIREINHLLRNKEIMQAVDKAKVEGYMNSLVQCLFKGKYRNAIYLFFDIKNKSLKLRS